jgi:hypothetical protein
VFDAVVYPSSIVKGMQFDIFQLVLCDHHHHIIITIIIIISTIVKLLLAKHASPQIHHTARNLPRFFHATISDITGLRLTVNRGCCALTS